VVYKGDQLKTHCEKQVFLGVGRTEVQPHRTEKAAVWEPTGYAREYLQAGNVEGVLSPWLGEPVPVRTKCPVQEVHGRDFEFSKPRGEEGVGT